jgi:hypothetical protein
MHEQTAEEESPAFEEPRLVELLGQDASCVHRRILVQLAYLAHKLLVLFVIDLNAKFPDHVLHGSRATSPELGSATSECCAVCSTWARPAERAAGSVGQGQGRRQERSLSAMPYESSRSPRMS